MNRFLSVFSATFFLLILFPFLILISIVIKMDSRGPVFFKQKRIGYGGRHFNIYKFRTMIVGAENIGSGLDSYHDDQRVTKFGGFLRNSSLDEIPQLFNILIGDMNFIGPRPPTTYHPYIYSKYPINQKERFKVKPGITGWAQVNGRNELSWDQKIDLDIYYVTNKSFLLDIKILYLTIIKVLKNENSYDLKK